MPSDYYKEFMTGVPIVFASEHSELLSRTKMLLEYSEVVAIHPQFTKLIAALTTAQEQEGKLLKHLTSHDDVLDAFRMCCKHYDTIHSAEESQRIAELKAADRFWLCILCSRLEQNSPIVSCRNAIS